MSRTDWFAVGLGSVVVAGVVAVAVIANRTHEPDAANLIDDWVVLRVDVTQAFERGTGEPTESGMVLFEVRPEDIVHGDRSIAVSAATTDAFRYMEFEIAGQWPSITAHPRVLSEEGIPVSQGRGSAGHESLRVSVVGDVREAGVLTFFLAKCEGESHLETVAAACMGATAAEGQDAAD